MLQLTKSRRKLMLNNNAERNKKEKSDDRRGVAVQTQEPRTINIAPPSHGTNGECKVAL